MKYLQLLLFLPTLVYSQTNPFDTNYYSNGSIKNILFENDQVITGYINKVTYSKTDSKKLLGNRIADTIYERQPSWPLPKSIAELESVPFNFTRKYYPDGVLMEQRPKKAQRVSYDELIIDKNYLSIHRNFKNDEFIDFYLSYIDSATFTIKRTIAYLKFSDGKFPLIQEFKVENDLYLEIRAYENGVIKSIISKNGKKVWNGKYLEFFPDGGLRELGYFKSGCRDGLWYEWYDNEQLKSIGSYFDCSKNRDELIMNFKDGSWKYFNLNGELVKTEEWKKGKLIQKAPSKG